MFVYLMSWNTFIRTSLKTLTWKAKTCTAPYIFMLQNADTLYECTALYILLKILGQNWNSVFQWTIDWDTYNKRTYKSAFYLISVFMYCSNLKCRLRPVSSYPEYLPLNVNPRVLAKISKIEICTPWKLELRALIHQFGIMESLLSKGMWKL